MAHDRSHTVSFKMLRKIFKGDYYHDTLRGTRHELDQLWQEYIYAIPTSSRRFCFIQLMELIDRFDYFVDRLHFPVYRHDTVVKKNETAEQLSLLIKETEEMEEAYVYMVQKQGFMQRAYQFGQSRIGAIHLPRVDPRYRNAILIFGRLLIIINKYFEYTLREDQVLRKLVQAYAH